MTEGGRGLWGVAGEILAFLRERRNYFLAPIVLLLLIVSVVVLAVEIPVLMPFIYALF